MWFASTVFRYFNQQSLIPLCGKQGKHIPTPKTTLTDVRAEKWSRCSRVTILVNCEDHCRLLSSRKSEKSSLLIKLKSMCKTKNKIKLQTKEYLISLTTFNSIYSTFVNFAKLAKRWLSRYNCNSQEMYEITKDILQTAFVSAAFHASLILSVI